MTHTQRPIRSIIADQDQEERACMHRILTNAGIEVLGAVEDAQDALALIRSAKPDVAVCEVDLGTQTAFDILDELGDMSRPECILVSSTDQYAARAFEYHAIDYIVTPCEKDRFVKAVSKIQGRFAAVNGTDSSGYLDRIVVKSRERIYFVNLEDVAWIEAAADYVHIHASGKRHIVRAKIGEIEKRLDPRRFVRIHRSTIVNLDRISELRPMYHGEYQVLLTDKTELTLSRGYRGRFSQFLMNPV